MNLQSIKNYVKNYIDSLFEPKIPYSENMTYSEFFGEEPDNSLDSCNDSTGSESGDITEYEAQRRHEGHMK